MPLRDLLDEAVGKVPTADPELCVHTHAEVASCQRCVTACPRDAWVLDDEELGLDTDRCDGCGLCVAGCPEGALSLSGAEPPINPGQSDVVIACELAGDGPHDWRPPCVHAASLQQLALLHRAGLRRLVLQTGDCGGCPRNDGAGLAGRLEQMNRVLVQRGLPGIELIDPGPDGPFRAVADEASGTRLSRRGFLRRVMGAAAELHSDDGDQRWRPPGEYLKPAAHGDFALAVPAIDPERCNGCDACVRICPHGALTLAPGAEAYLITADSCTACRLCSDVCDRDAVIVEECTTFQQLQLPLRQGRCRACGAAFHRPRAAEGHPTLCNVCTQINHQRSLFQVL